MIGRRPPTHQQLKPQAQRSARTPVRTARPPSRRDASTGHRAEASRPPTNQPSHPHRKESCTLTGTDPTTDTPEDVAKAQRQLKVLQWAIPALTGAVLIVNARMGEQQRPAQVTGRLLGRLRPGRAA